MTAQNAYWCSTKKISCADEALPRPVILCVPTSINLAGQPYIFATLTAVSTSCGGCSLVYSYTFSYDDEQMVDPTAILTSAEISGVICEDCLTSWIEALTAISAEETNALFRQVDGLYVPENLIETEDSTTVEFAITPSAPQALTAFVKRSSNTGNILTAESDGLYVGPVYNDHGTFTATGATPVVVPSAFATASMLVVYGLNTVGGTPGAKPYETGFTNGVSFSVACAPGDTSVYNWGIITIFT